MYEPPMFDVNVEKNNMQAEIERLRKVLDEAAELLRVAHYAHQKMGLEGEGNHGHSHEVRMFAMHFSQREPPKTPEHTILSGDGRFQKWWSAYRSLSREQKEGNAAGTKSGTPPTVS